RAHTHGCRLLRGYSDFRSRIPRPPRTPLFPYTTLFRSLRPGRLPVSPRLDLVPAFGDCDVRHARRGGDRRSEPPHARVRRGAALDRKSTRLNSSHVAISYAVFCLKKKKPRPARRTASAR